jgi:hypothetical protein
VINITDIESFLREYSYAERKIRRLECELIAKMTARDNVSLMPGHGYDAIRSKNKRIVKPTEKAAVILVDHYAEEIKRIESELERARATIDAISSLIEKSGLDHREREYIQYRYLEGRSSGKTEKLMNVTNSHRIRRTALEKLGKVFSQLKRQTG